MASVDELLNSSSENEEEYQRLTKYLLSADYSDDEGPIEIDGRTIGDTSNEISVEGEDNSQYINFIMPRYYDGIDLVDMIINIHYELSDGTGSNDYPVNAYYSDEHIKFGWIIPQYAVSMSGTISFCIFAVGSKNRRNYIFKTETKRYVVKSGLDIDSGIIEPDEDWYLNFVLRLEQTTEELIQKAYDDIDEYAKKAMNIDSELSKTSSNAVQNKAIATAIDEKQNKIMLENGYLIL